MQATSATFDLPPIPARAQPAPARARGAARAAGAEVAVAEQRLLDEIAPTVRAILRRKSGMSLTLDDRRPDNVDAIELCHDVLVRVWERIATDRGERDAIADLRGYAASVAHNAWSDHLRRKYPRRASLKSRLRYFLGHQPRFALWPGVDGELLAGPAAWQLGAPPSADPERIVRLRDRRDRLADGALPCLALDRYAAADWDRLLGALFAQVGAPVGLDDLTAVVAVLVELKEDRVESLDALDEEGREGAAAIDDAARGPEGQACVRSVLRELWSAILALKPDYRRAYLLNIPAPGKSRGDLEVFVMHGIATPAQIEAALALDEAQTRTACAALGVDATADAGRFGRIWPHLPMADSLIGCLLGLAPQQVINRRMLALRELARTLGDKADKA